MITKIELDSYKSFLNQPIDIAPLTVLTGLNGSGKSTVIQALRMITCASESKDNHFLSGYGDYEELRSRYNSKLNSKIKISVHSQDHVHTLSVDKEKAQLETPVDFISEYISAERLGPQTNLPINATRRISIGERGEFCADYFNKFEACIVGDLLYREERVSKTLKEQLSCWMNDISPNIDLEFSLDKKHDISNVEIDGHRATNTGFGISYALPIVMSALVLSSKRCTDFKEQYVEDWYHMLSDKHKLLLIENPEAHIHPSGQTQLGVLAVLAAKSGVQVIVETHSDHFIDGIRIACKELNFNNKSIINYFTKDKDTPSSVEKITILDSGELSNWPTGFFDQIQKNLSRLAELNYG
ncbi:AAA family ATPase [Vibrio splendidus]|jgi:predicted ATPase|uniref:AAA family ATPase n=1 Tax=Vibrio splendidus TaxID=29497 RepID=UPI0021B1E1B4|nr:DUF3696 domain-containing protein [Vibrio splendidus]UWZ97870.1 DUF3696 domain-containing protein [Vibrio splendidus]